MLASLRWTALKLVPLSPALGEDGTDPLKTQPNPPGQATPVIECKLGWVIVYVDSPPAASDFYAQTFGLPRLRSLVIRLGDGPI